MNSLFVLFGGTGDLAFKKLMPAFYNLIHEHMIPQKFAIVSIGRRKLSHREYRIMAREAIEKHARFPFDDWRWREFADHIYYYQMNFNNTDDYAGLESYLSELDEQYETAGNKLFYLATAPDYFKIIVNALKPWVCMKCSSSWNRVLIEKPFGHDLISAQDFNASIQEVFNENDIFRIDHYLGKEMIQNIMVLRFANEIFEPIWNKEHIDHIQITVAEKMGVGSRGRYYEKSGALRDMVQNHILQILALIAMDKPEHYNTEAIRNAKVNIFKHLQTYSDDTLKDLLVFGQYLAHRPEDNDYIKEPHVDSESDTETFVAMKVCIESDRWKGVPFYIRTGKSLKKKTAKVIVRFKEQASAFREGLEPNTLVIRIQPHEGIDLRFNMKTPGAVHEIKPAHMDFCQNCEHGNQSPEAYEKLIFDALSGDSTLFTRWDEVEAAWRFIDRITKSCVNKKELTYDYITGSWGPAESDKMIEKDQRKWLDL